MILIEIVSFDDKLIETEICSLIFGSGYSWVSGQGIEEGKPLLARRTKLYVYRLFSSKLLTFLVNWENNTMMYHPWKILISPGQSFYVILCS